MNEVSELKNPSDEINWPTPMYVRPYQEDEDWWNWDEETKRQFVEKIERQYKEMEQGTAR